MSKMVKCPCLNCGMRIGIGKFPASSRSKEEAILLMKDHLLRSHSFRDLEEWLERCLVDYFEDEL